MVTFRPWLKLVWLLLAPVGFATVAAAKPWWVKGSASGDQDFLPPDAAFRIAARLDGGSLEVRWAIADGYYLYRNKIEVKAESPDLFVDSVTLPRGRLLTDPTFGPQEVYFQQSEATVAFQRLDHGAHALQFKVTYQGCAQRGLCYPPITKVISPTGPPSPTPASPSGTWEGVAIGGGGAAFLCAGLVLRRGRRLPTPAA